MAVDEPGPLEAGKQWGDRSGIQVQALAQVADCDQLTFPEHQHHQVLGVGQAKWCEQRPVAGGHRPCRSEDREGQLCGQCLLRRPWLCESMAIQDCSWRWDHHLQCTEDNEHDHGDNADQDNGSYRPDPPPALSAKRTPRLVGLARYAGLRLRRVGHVGSPFKGSERYRTPIFAYSGRAYVAIHRMGGITSCVQLFAAAATGPLIKLQPGQHDGVEGVVRGSVTTPVEPVAASL